MVERRTPEREVGVRFLLRSPCSVFEQVLHRNSTVARRVTNVTSEHYGNP